MAAISRVQKWSLSEVTVHFHMSLLYAQRNLQTKNIIAIINKTAFKWVLIKLPMVSNSVDSTLY